MSPRKGLESICRILGESRQPRQTEAGSPSAVPAWARSGWGMGVSVCVQECRGLPGLAAGRMAEEAVPVREVCTEPALFLLVRLEMAPRLGALARHGLQCRLVPLLSMLSKVHFIPVPPAPFRFKEMKLELAGGEQCSYSLQPSAGPKNAPLLRAWVPGTGSVLTPSLQRGMWNGRPAVTTSEATAPGEAPRAVYPECLAHAWCLLPASARKSLPCRANSLGPWVLRAKDGEG